MNDTWKPANLYTLDWHAEQCERYAKGLPIEGRTDEPITGIYRGRLLKGGVFLPFYIYYDGPQLLCEIDGSYIYAEDEKLPNGQTIRKMWEFLVKEPIRLEVYDYYNEHGRWPEEPILSNNAPDDNSAEALESQIASLEEEAKRLLASTPAKTQEECNQASVLVGKLNEWFQYDGDREWLKNRTRMDARITPAVIEAHETYTKVGMSILNSVKRCEIFKDLKQKFQKPFLKKLKAEYEARGETMPVQHAVLGYPATHLSTRKKAKIKDRKACLEHYINNAKLDTLLQSLADAEVKSTKKAPPGCEVVEEDIAS